MILCRRLPPRPVPVRAAGIAQQQDGDTGIDRHHDEFEREKIRVHHPVRVGTENEVETVEGGNVAVLQRNVVVRRKHHEQRQVGDGNGKRDALGGIHGARPFSGRPAAPGAKPGRNRMVEVSGIEPLASTLRTSRSPN
jgi:hypothetical protein